MSNKTVTREELVKALEPLEGLETKKFKMGDNRIEFDIDNNSDTLLYRLDDEEYKLSRRAYVKACRMVGISEAYFRKFDFKDLDKVNSHLNHWHEKNDMEGSALVNQDNEVLSFIRGNTPYYSRLKVLEDIESVLAPTPEAKRELLYDKVYSDIDKGVFFSVISNQSREMKVGDLVRGGVSFSDHILNEKPLLLGGYVWRLVCSNGMISAEALNKYSRKSNVDNMSEWVKACTKQCDTDIHKEFDRIYKLQEIPVDNYGADVLNSIYSQFNVSTAIRTKINEALINSGDVSNMYDLFNAITSAANHTEYTHNPQVINGIQRLASSLTSHNTICPQCHSVHKTPVECDTEEEGT